MDNPGHRLSLVLTWSQTDTEERPGRAICGPSVSTGPSAEGWSHTPGPAFTVPPVIPHPRSGTGVRAGDTDPGEQAASLLAAGPDSP